MKRFLGAVVLGGLGAAAVAAVLARARTAAGSGRRIGADGTARTGAADGKGRVTMEDPQTAANGRPDAHDPLGAAHVLSPPEAERVRAKERLVGGKATSREREALYDDTEGVPVSGSQGETPVQSDRNPIGPPSHGSA